MSLFEDASLIVTPNAVKAGKLYSIKPTDGSGDLSVVRATTATRVNEDGLIESVGTNIPRLDYSNGCPSILVEPQRTNLITNSLGYSSGSNYTITTNNLSLDGSNNAILATEKTTPGTYIINSVSATILPSTTYTYSFFVKSNGITTLPINASDGVVGNISSVNIITGQVISGSAIVTNYNNGWFRISVTRTTSATASSGFMQCNFGAKTGDGVSGFYLYGFQIEAGSNATSYIPTTSASVTRNADVISKTGISDLIDNSELTLFIDFDTNITNTSSNINMFMLDDGTTSNCVSSSIVSNYVYTRTSSGGVFRQILGGTTTPQRFKVAIKIKQNSFKYFRNGIQISGEITDNNMPTGLNRIKLGENADSFINVALVFPTLLTDQQCIDLTTI
jgi:hypothetical protein